MNDNEKWLEAAAGIEQDILYLKAVLRASERPYGLEKELECLRTALTVYRKNAATGVPWPSPDDLFCISTPSRVSLEVSTGMRRGFKLAS